MDSSASVEMNAEGAAAGGIFMIIWAALVVLMIVSSWKIYTKAGKPGWACLIPFYNIYVMLEIAGKPGWWLILFFIPIANIVVAIMMLVGLAANFGKGAGYVLGFIFLPIIFYPMLAFGSAQYQPVPPAAPAAA